MRRQILAMGFRASLAGCLWLVLVAPAAAELKLATIFTDHMVLQRDQAVNVWGNADAGAEITVTVAEKSATGRAGDDGKWRVSVPALAAGGPHELAVSTSTGDQVKLADVLVGEVWVCSGQSNMAWTMTRVNNADEEIAAANYPQIRLVTVPRRPVPEPQESFEGSWVVCSPETVPEFSAVGYFFGRELYKELNVPIGLINTSYGGTPAEAWTSLPAMQAKASLAPLLKRWDDSVAGWDPDQAEADFKLAMEKWEAAAAKAKEDGKPEPRRPRMAANPAVSAHRPSNLYNGMIQPLIPFGIRGAIWYQGESNASRAYQYRTVFATMIENWREQWGQGDFPFIFVQLANFRAVKDEPAESDWAELREAQLMTRRHLPNTGMAVIIDIGEANDIHPRNKQDVGKRLALWALANTYGQKDLVYSGPMLFSAEQRGDQMVLKFKSVGGGLVAKGNDGKLTGFSIAGPDKKFVWADAKIDGDTIVVSSPDVKDPQAVRYGWADNPICNLYNKEGLPASPFRTDNWPGITRNSQ